MPGTVDGSFSWYFWVPIVGPLVGGVIGVLVYDWFIGDVLHARDRLARPAPEPGRTREPGQPEPGRAGSEAAG
jgi:glycerol uptake facilitator protein